MECFAVFLIIVCLAALAIVGIGQRVRHGRGRRRLFQQLARRFGGRCSGGHFLARPVVSLRYGETWALVSETRDVGPLSGAAWQVRVAWPYPHSCCAIVAAGGFPLRRSHLYQWPFVQLDNHDFSQHYLVTGPDADDVRQQLTPGICWHIERLRRLGSDPRLYVLIQNGQILVQKYWRQARGDLPAQFVQGVLELYDQCMVARASGIEFVDPSVTRPLEQVSCRVCGDSISDDLVYCRRCKTPHHQECWQYTGICSVFGCRETVYLQPQHGQFLQPPGDEDRPVKKPR